MRESIAPKYVHRILSMKQLVVLIFHEKFQKSENFKGFFVKKNDILLGKSLVGLGGAKHVLKKNTF